MNKFIEGILLGFGAIIVIGIVAIFGGTLIYWLWPIAIPAAFPGLVKSGVLASGLSWWASICLSWIFGILIKSTQTNNNNNNCNKS